MDTIAIALVRIIAGEWPRDMTIEEIAENAGLSPEDVATLHTAHRDRSIAELVPH